MNIKEISPDTWVVATPLSDLDAVFVRDIENKPALILHLIASRINLVGIPSSQESLRSFIDFAFRHLSEFDSVIQVNIVARKNEKQHVIECVEMLNTLDGRRDILDIRSIDYIENAKTPYFAYSFKERAIIT
jgi:hypothetical protein